MTLKESIISVLTEWGKSNSQYDGMWYRYPALIDEIKENTGIEYTLKDVKKAMSELNKLGIVRKEPTYDYDFNFCGSGWFINDLKKKGAKQ